jgi:hypothetical protein
MVTRNFGATTAEIIITKLNCLEVIIFLKFYSSRIQLAVPDKHLCIFLQQILVTVEPACVTTTESV